MPNVAGYAAAIASFVCAISALHLMTSPARPRPLQVLLAVFFGLFGAQLALMAFQIGAHHADVARIRVVLVLLGLPAAYLFCRNLALPSHRVLTARDAVHLTPAFAALVAIWAGRGIALDVIVMLAEAGYGFLIVLLLGPGPAAIERQGRYRQRRIRWLAGFLALFVALLFADITIFVQSSGGRPAGDTPAFTLSMAGLFVAAALVGLAAMGRNSVFSWLESGSAAHAVGEAAQAGGASDSFAHLVAQTIAKPQIYADENLTIAKLAKRMGAPVRKVSGAINRDLACSFSELVSETRINAAKKMLASPEGRSTRIVDIALNVGFGSKSNFNKEFKRITGYTPSAYRDLVHPGRVDQD